MSRLAIALDLGTSGFRAQALDMANDQVLSTAITNRHPLPGSNVIDHLHFALEMGVENARDLILQAINKLLHRLRVNQGDVARLAVCGNPTQLSLFQGMEIRDLAYAGSRKLKKLEIEVPQRAAEIRPGGEFPALSLKPDCEIIIPPSVHDEIGADALALIMQSGIRHCAEAAIAIDYGTNAEMALIHQGTIYTGSAAAGPALEGQHISCGSLAMPGVIADLEQEGPYQRLRVLDGEMLPKSAALVDPRLATDPVEARQPGAKAITGTGVIAAIERGLTDGIIALPRIRTADQRLHFGREIFLSEQDLGEAGKAIGAIRAGYFTLSRQAGIEPANIRIAYLAGASGTYVDAFKSMRLGLVPPSVQRVVQVGNTSLAMARELALTPSRLDEMSELAEALRHTHTLFANSKLFAQLFLLELSYWTEGMPMKLYREMLQRYRLPDLPPVETSPQILRRVDRDIDDPGEYGLITLESIGSEAALQFQGCHACLGCMKSCPTNAITIDETTRPATISLAYSLCNGVACRRCESECEPKVFRLNDFFQQTRIGDGGEI